MEPFYSDIDVASTNEELPYCSGRNRRERGVNVKNK